MAREPRIGLSHERLHHLLTLKLHKSCNCSCGGKRGADSKGIEATLRRTIVGSGAKRTCVTASEGAYGRVEDVKRTTRR